MTLFDYYGGKLPSISQRATTYKQAGFNDPYFGTANQNNQLEGWLRKQGNATNPTAPAGVSNNMNPGANTATNPFPGYLSQATQAFAPLGSAENASIAKQQALNTAQTQDLQQRLKENAGYATGAINENQNNLGLLQSGSTTNAVAGLQRDVANQLNQADIQNAINNANLALQGAQFNAQTVLPGALNYASGMTGGLQSGAQFGSQQAQLLQNLLLSPLYHNIPDQALREILQSYGFGGSV